MTAKRRHEERIARRKAAIERDKHRASGRGEAVDQTALGPGGGYSQPDFVERGYYLDQPFVCESCGIDQVWTAAQQKWWYEVAKGSLYSRATHCRACRHKRKSGGARSQNPRADRTPYRTARTLLTKIQVKIEPKLLAAGFQPSARKTRARDGSLFIDYTRANDLFTLSWTRSTQTRLAAEHLTNASATLEVIAEILVDAKTDLNADLELFMTALERFVENLKPRPAPDRSPDAF
jgi:hypothetical protein